MEPDKINQLKDDIMELGNVIASAALRLQSPAKDEITFRQASLEFSRKWLELQIDRCRVRGVRKGKHKNSPIIFSRFELLAIKEAEKRTTTMIRKQTNI